LITRKFYKLFYIFLFLSFNAYSAQDNIESINKLVPKEYKLIEVIKGDLNNDKQDDIVLLVKAKDSKLIVKNRFGKTVDRNRRGLLIAFRKEREFIPVLKNLDCFSSENEDGGVYFPPELSVEIKKEKLFISFQHGRYGYWIYTFRYKPDDFELIGYDSSDNHGPVVDSVLSINFLTNKILNKVNVNAEAEGDDEVFKETWSTIKNPKSFKLSNIKNFDEFSME
jgi:hypothetical protein